jgi:hypothetical protein
VLRDPVRFAAADVVQEPAARVPAAAYRLAHRVLPGYIWLGVKGSRSPAGAPLDPAP